MDKTLCNICFHRLVLISKLLHNEILTIVNNNDTKCHLVQKEVHTGAHTFTSENIGLLIYRYLNDEYRGKQRTGRFRIDMANTFCISKFLRPSSI